LQEKLA
jgi:chromosome segregation ATPase